MKLLILLALVAIAASRPQEENLEPAVYAFDWAVADEESGTDFGHSETRDGDNTEGRYEVLLPDGRRQIVTYSVTAEGGFVADVTYEGEAIVEKKK